MIKFIILCCMAFSHAADTSDAPQVVIQVSERFNQEGISLTQEEKSLEISLPLKGENETVEEYKQRNSEQVCSSSIEYFNELDKKIKLYWYHKFRWEICLLFLAVFSVATTCGILVARYTRIDPYAQKLQELRDNPRLNGICFVN